MVYEWVQLGAVTLIFVLGFVVGGIHFYGGTPKKILIHLSEMGSHTVSQCSSTIISTFQFKTEDQHPRVRTLRPPSTYTIPIFFSEKNIHNTVLIN